MITNQTDPGPQRGPASVPQIEAQVKQTSKELSASDMQHRQHLYAIGEIVRLEGEVERLRAELKEVDAAAARYASDVVRLTRIVCDLTDEARGVKQENAELRRQVEEAKVECEELIKTGNVRRVAELTKEVFALRQQVMAYQANEHECEMKMLRGIKEAEEAANEGRAINGH